MVLNLLNLYSLIFALFDKINDMTPELESFKRNLTRTANTSLQTHSAEIQCFNVCNTETDTLKAYNLIAAIATNVSSTMYPIMQKALKNANTQPDNETIDSEFTTPFTFPGIYVSSKDFSENYTEDAFMNTENFTFYDDVSSSTANPTTTADYEEYDEYDLYEDSLPELSGNDIKESTTETSTTTEKLMIKVRKKNDTRTVCKRLCHNVTKPKEETAVTVVTIIDETALNYSTRKRLRSLCWETMFGQELIKLTVMDLIMTILSTLTMDFVRGIFVRYMNRCWCWDLEKKFPQYADFKVAENILHLVNNQGMVWMGMFFSPGLIVLNVAKLFLMMYFRAWIVLCCNVPHEIIFRASRSNNFYYALLLMMLFLCVLPVGYAIVRIPPSGNCGPFSNHQRIFHILTKTIKDNVPEIVRGVLDYIASPGIIIPLLLLLVLIIYYLVSLTSALREANTDLKFQLRRERTEERRKMFQLADRRRKGGPGGSGEFSNTPFAKWKKLMHTVPGKSFDDTSPRIESNEFPKVKEEKTEIVKSKDIFSKFIKKALRKTSISEEENNETQNQDEGTDTEQHESLPEDLVSIKEGKPFQSPLPVSSGSFDYHRSILQKRNSQKSMSESSDKYNQLKESKPKRELRQDSSSSVWSDNIPVITISKTESAECLDVVPEMTKVAPLKSEPETKFKPKIKCALQKQSTEIDEDVICYFSKDLDLKPVTFGLEEKDAGVISESSEDTARDNSTDTVVMVKPQESSIKEEDDTIENISINGSATEPSAEYDDIMSL